MSDDQREELEKKVCAATCFSREEREALLELVKFVPFLRWCKFTLKVFRAGTVFLGIVAAAILAWGTIGTAFKEVLKTWLN